MMKNLIPRVLKFLTYKRLDKSLTTHPIEHKYDDKHLRKNLSQDWLAVGDMLKTAMEEFESKHGKK